MLDRQITALHAPEIADLHITLAQLKTLYVVGASGPIRMGSLAVRLGTALSTTSGVVDRLVGMGLLQRAVDPDDRRQVLVESTPEAHRQLERMSELSRDRMRDLLGRLSSVADVETVERAVRLLAGAAATITEDTEA